MARQPLEEIQIEGFTSIRSATVQLGRLNVLVGANGAGKSNFVQALGLLGRTRSSAVASEKHAFMKKPNASPVRQWHRT
jgi:predicted ATPase